MNQIITDKCDSCGLRTPCVLFHHRGTPVMAWCKECDQRSFEEAARVDINAWLRGGSPAPFGR